MDWLFSRIRELQLRHDEAIASMKRIMDAHFERLKTEGLRVEDEPLPNAARGTPEEASRSSAEIFEMKLYAESFYYFAGRARALARHKDAPLPGLERFEAEGARNVRNQLIEHPERSDSRVFIGSWGTGINGPVMKAGRYKGQEEIFPDPGLFVNAAEFRDRLNSLLLSALRDYGA